MTLPFGLNRIVGFFRGRVTPTEPVSLATIDMDAAPHVAETPAEVEAEPEKATAVFVHDNPGGTETVDFTCNVCGTDNRGAEKLSVQNREAGSCGVCRSSLRMRSVIYALSTSLFGTGMPIAAFPKDPDIRGIGMSDWEEYAHRLAARVGYVNTFYHAEPHLDITDLPAGMEGRHDFLISTDVFEHIPLSGLDAAFANARALLKDGGVFVFTVPFTKTGETIEHFPDLNDFEIVETEGRYVMHNTTRSGETQTFSDLIFHGGPGMTLEMRLFSEPDLLQRLHEAGFSSVRVHDDIVPEVGILWPMNWAVPIVARR